MQISPTLNLGILAHVDAGKTSLTERLLHAAGVIDTIGSVDDGSTQTDSLDLERRRGITIKSAVASFPVGEVTVNLIDTPGHPDFIAEVERALGVLDGAVLVVSAVEGVQPQSRVLMRTLRRLSIPTLIFVNKIDRAGARPGAVVDEIAARLTPAVVAMTAVTGAGGPAARAVPYEPADEAFRTRLIETLAERDDALLADYLADETALGPARLRAELAAQSRRALVHPVFAGSAITGAGVPALTGALTELLPRAGGDPAGPVRGTVFKVERGPAGGKTAWVRMFSGTVRVRDRLPYGRPGDPGGERPAGRVTAISVVERGADRPRPAVRAGQLARLRGLGAIRIGDPVGDLDAGDRPAGGARHFAPPSLETVVTPVRAADRAALHLALADLAEQDPLINLRQDGPGRQIAVSLYGEVQKEVIGATLAEEYGIGVRFAETTTLHIERPVGTGAAVEVMRAADNPFLATVGLRIDPAPVGTGVRFRLEIELGSLPTAFINAVEETVHRTLGQGLYGWRVTDCTVTLTRSGYAPRQSHAHAVFDKSMSSTAGDFRHLTPLVLMTALRRAGVRVYEPMHRFRLEIPAEQFGAVLPVLSRLRAVPRTSATEGGTAVVEGALPAASVHALELRLPPLTSGEGVLESAFDHYQEVSGEPPVRPRTDHDPLHRKEYLLRVVRRVPGLG